ncbi:hypothetical protein [Pseudomonas ovata]|uniref:hypothetical protein n=1 Tax=Pseudomonas ovata TaxID=1839709 RepID=UPI000D69E0D9|nr:hypothetical protein [Pseudomonas ovata]
MSHTSCTTPQAKLPAPVIPMACRHGVGLLAAPQLTVQIPAYEAMDEGDLIELFWDGCYVASAVLSRDDMQHSVALRVPESFLQNGKARTYYRVMKIGGTPLTSLCHKLWVKLDAPGGQLPGSSEEENQGLAPLSLSPCVARRGLTPRHLESGLPLTIEPYLNMATHDEITLRWGDLRLDLPPLREEDIDNPIDLVIPPALIREAIETQPPEITYCIIDRVGNHSYWAPSRALNIQLLESEV